MKAYFANGLFSQADLMYNDYLAKRLEEKFPSLQLYLPQRNMEINDKNSYASSEMIANGDDKHLFQSDFMIALIDGVAIDEGVACEIGSFQTLGQFEYEEELCRTGKVTHRKFYRPIFALYTDSRQQGRDNSKKINALIEDSVENQFPYRNLYVIGKIKSSGGAVFSSIEDLEKAIKQYIVTFSKYS